MKKLWLVAVALMLAGSLAYTMAFAQDTARHAAPKSVASKRAPKSKDAAPVSTKSVAARTALCKADCLPDNYKACDSWGCTGMHGLYRSYSKFDPQLKSIEGRKGYAECVRTCLAPLPTVYIQRPVFALGMNWFGKSQRECLDCHIRGH